MNFLERDGVHDAFARGRVLVLTGRSLERSAHNAPHPAVARDARNHELFNDQDSRDAERDRCKHQDRGATTRQGNETGRCGRKVRTADLLPPSRELCALPHQVASDTKGRVLFRPHVLRQTVGFIQMVCLRCGAASGIRRWPHLLIATTPGEPSPFIPPEGRRDKIAIRLRSPFSCEDFCAVGHHRHRAW